MTDEEWEDKLAQVRLSRVSENLDERMEALFAASRRSARSRRVSPWLLLAGAACALGAILLIFPIHRRPPPEVVTVTIVQPSFTQSQSRLVRLLLEPGRSEQPLPGFTVSILTR